MKIKCHIFGHLPTLMALSVPQEKEWSGGFACWRCGIRLGWDGGNGFSELSDYRTGLPDLVNTDAFAYAKSQHLVKGRSWCSVIAEDDKVRQSKGEITMGPLHPDDLPDWIKKLEKQRK